MFKSLMTLTGALVVGVFFCFAVALQAQPAGPASGLPRVDFFAKETSQRVAVLSLDLAATLKRREQSLPAECCFCERNAALVSQTVSAFPLRLGWPLTFDRRPYFSNVSSPGDIREINLDDLKKIIQRDPKDTRPLLINFWATWCDPCREEFPDLVKVDADYRSKGLNFVAVSLDDISDIKTAVPKFLNEMKATMPVVLLNVNDPEPAIKAVDAGWDGQLPATFLYDKDGKIVFRHFGKIDAAELRAAIDKTVGKPQ